MFIGGILGMILGDKFGRRLLMLASLLLNGVAGLCAAVSSTLWWMTLFRFLAGIGTCGTRDIIFDDNTVSHFHSSLLLPFVFHLT
jgi:MFS family permease